MRSSSACRWISYLDLQFEIVSTCFKIKSKNCSVVASMIEAVSLHDSLVMLASSF